MNSTPETPTDEVLLAGIRQGEEKAYRGMFEQYYPILTTFALKHTEDIDLAKELVQEVFIKLYQKRDTLMITQSLKSYLFRAVYHTCLNTLNQNRRRQEHHQHAAEQQPTADFTDNLVEAESLQQIYQAVDALPEQCRRIFVMNRFEGVDNQAIADRLGLSKRTVETQISKALRLLRKTLLALWIIISNFFLA
ncbi:MAG: RNA polymerase sigma-70 factor [Tunicatimonas sp.]